DAVGTGIDYLLTTQQEDGDWCEEMFTGTGFPKVFYLKYHLYRLYFPLMALARYKRAISNQQPAISDRQLAITQKTTLSSPPSAVGYRYPYRDSGRLPSG